MENLPPNLPQSPEAPEEQIEKEEGKETKKENSFLEIDGQKIELEKYYFEYPKNVQEETGILGYEKDFISKEQIFIALRNSLPEEVIESINLELDINLDLVLVDNFSLQNIFEKINQYGRNLSDRNDNHRTFYSIVENFSKELLNKITDSKFPEECFTYVMHTTEVAKSQFVDDKFILQNIFDFNAYQKLSKKEEDKSFGEVRNPVFRSKGLASNTEPDATLFAKVSNIDNKIKDSFGSKYTGPTDYIFNSFKENGLDDDTSLVSANGLNVAACEFFFDYNILDGAPAFGFYRKDKLLQDYISKSIDRLREINMANKKEPDGNGYQHKIFSNRIFLDLFAAKEFENSKENFTKSGFGFKQLLPDTKYKDFISSLIDKYGSALSSQPDDMHKLLDYKYLEDENENLTAYGMESRGDIDPLNYSKSSSSSWHLPIFINDSKVRNIKWGHANFASFFTKKGFNVLKIKHADQLPNPKDFKESQREE